MKRLKVAKVKMGDTFGNWKVTRYVPLTFDDLGSANGGEVELTHQESSAVITIQHDHALRGAKWWVSYEGKTIEDSTPEKVIKRLLRVSKVAGYDLKGGMNKFHGYLLSILDKKVGDFAAKNIKGEFTDQVSYTVSSTYNGVEIANVELTVQDDWVEFRVQPLAIKNMQVANMMLEEGDLSKPKGSKSVRFGIDLISDLYEINKKKGPVPKIPE